MLLCLSPSVSEMARGGTSLYTTSFSHMASKEDRALDWDGWREGRAERKKKEKCGRNLSLSLMIASEEEEEAEEGGIIASTGVPGELIPREGSLLFFH